MRDKTNSKLHRVALLAALLPIIIYNYFGEHVALCDGYGWDGCVFYRNIVENGIDEYLSDAISYYHTHRMLPFLITHYIMKLAAIEPVPGNVMLVSSTINILLLGLSVCLFFKISDKLKWNRNTEIVAFSCAFYNFHVLKFMGYCPVMTDMPTFALCWATAYGFVRSKTAILIAVGLLAIVTFPLLSLIVLILVALPRQEVGNVTPADKRRNKANALIGTALKAFYMLWLPVTFCLYALFRWKVKGAGNLEEIFIIRHPQSLAMAVAGILAYIAFYYLATRPLNARWTAMLRAVSTPAHLTKTVVAIIVFFILYKLPPIHGTDGPFSLVNEIALICQYPPTDILIFAETPFLYLGPSFILIMLFWPKICRSSMTWGMSYFMVLLLSLLFFPDIETRKLICFYIFILLPMAGCVDSLNVRAVAAIAFAAIQMAVSFFWIEINVPGIEHYFETYSVDVYMQWPAQRYYMFQGPWQSHHIYMAVLAAEMILTAIFISYIRKKH